MATSEASLQARRRFIERLYGEPALFGLARLVGYSGIPERELNLQLKGVELPRGAQATFKEALAEITLKGEDGVVKLTEQARRCCRVLLGPAPESGEREAWLKLTGRSDIAAPKKAEKEAKRGSKTKSKPKAKEVPGDAPEKGSGVRRGGSGSPKRKGNAKAGKGARGDGRRA